MVNHELAFAIFCILLYINFMSFTYKPKKRKRAKTHGFLVRQKTRTGKAVIKRRRQKGRKQLTVKKSK